MATALEVRARRLLASGLRLEPAVALSFAATFALIGCSREGGEQGGGEAIAWYLTMHGNEGGNAVVAIDRDGGAVAIVCSARDVPKDVSFRQPR